MEALVIGKMVTLRKGAGNYSFYVYFKQDQEWQRKIWPLMNVEMV